MCYLLRYLILFFITTHVFAGNLPPQFVYLKTIDPTIIQEMRYAQAHNFVGRPIAGYFRDQCILTKEAAYALKRVQDTLRPLHLSLKVYDCYRPTQAVQDFWVWSQDNAQEEMKAEFYPHINKRDLFKLEYVALKSGHSRGSTVDLTIVSLPLRPQPTYQKGQPLLSCTALKRFADNSIQMGSGFDCMDTISHNDAKLEISHKAYSNRLFLREKMQEQGFLPYEKEWWHFTLKEEPYPDTYFNFPVK